MWDGLVSVFFVRKGAAKPVLSSVEAFRKSLSSAKSIAYVDPAGGGASGIYVDELLEKLGLKAELASKVKIPPRAHNIVAAVVKGAVDFAFGQISEILDDSSIDFAGPLPDDIQNYTRFSAGVLASSKQPQPAKALIEFLSTPHAAEFDLEPEDRRQRRNIPVGRCGGAGSDGVARHAAAEARPNGGAMINAGNNAPSRFAACPLYPSKQTSPMSALCQSRTLPGAIRSPRLRTRATPNRNCQAEGLCGLEVDHELELGWLHDRQIGGLRTLKDAAGIDAKLAIYFGSPSVPVTHQATSGNKFAKS